MKVLTAEESGLCCRVHPIQPSAAETPTVPARPSTSNTPPGNPTLIYLPGLHGDWTLLGPFREALRGRLSLIEFTYPRREDWNLEDHARAVLEELARHGITTGWILGESFSSQVAWAITRLLENTTANSPGAASASADISAARFNLSGLILVGGFVRHPLPWGVAFAAQASRAVPRWVLGRLCESYGRWARRRCAMTGSAAGEIELFVTRRLQERDRRAINSRYQLIRDDDLRRVARGMRSPVYCLTGAVDPIVPWPAVVRWLARHCPGYRGERVIWRAGHNVLLDAPGESAEQIVKWLSRDNAVGQPAFA